MVPRGWGIRGDMALYKSVKKKKKRLGWGGGGEGWGVLNNSQFILMKVDGEQCAVDLSIWDTTWGLYMIELIFGQFWNSFLNFIVRSDSSFQARNLVSLDTRQRLDNNTPVVPPARRKRPVHQNHHTWATPPSWFPSHTCNYRRILLRTLLIRLKPHPSVLH